MKSNPPQRSKFRGSLAAFCTPEPPGGLGGHRSILEHKTGTRGCPRTACVKRALPVLSARKFRRLITFEIPFHRSGRYKISSLVVAGQEVLIVSDVCDVLFWGLRLVTLIINAAACTNATAHPQRGRHRTTSHTSRSVRSPETCILHPQARRPDTTVPGPRSRLLFLPATRHTSCRYSTLVGLHQKELLVYFSGKRAEPLLILRASTGQGIERRVSHPSRESGISAQRC